MRLNTNNRNTPGCFLVGFLMILLVGLLCGCETVPGSTSVKSTFQPDAVYLPAAMDTAYQSQLRAEAVGYLLGMTENEYAGYRANAIEALQAEPTIGEEVARIGLMDDNAGVRFASAMVIGRMEYGASAPLAHALINDENDSVRAAAIFALVRNGYQIDLSPLAEMLESSDSRTRANAALVIGELGDPTAVSLLRDTITLDNPRAPLAAQRIFQLQVAEALVKLGDMDSISRIRAPLYSRDPDDGEITAFAAAILGRIGDHRSKHDLVKLVAMWKQYRNSAEVRLAAMASLAQLGEPPDVDLVTEYLGPTYQDAEDLRMRSIRAQAVYTLGQIGTPSVLPHLAHLFYLEPDDLVKIPTATAVLQIVSHENR